MTSSITNAFWLAIVLLIPAGGHASDAISNITNSPNYSTTYGAKNILGNEQSISRRGYLDDTIRSDHWQQSYGNQPYMRGVINPQALIRSTQTLLIKLGMLSGPADGILGLQTHRSILRYQHQHKLMPSGSPSPELWRHLNARVAALPAKADKADKAANE